MNNIRKIIADKIAELKDKRVTDYADGFNDGLFEAFKIFLEEIPAPRTEADILKDFEKLGWIVSRNDEDDFTLRLKGNPTCAIYIDKLSKEYSMSCCLDMQEHKLLSELFEVLGW